MKTEANDLRTLRGQLIDDMRNVVTAPNEGQRSGNKWREFHLLNASQEILGREIEARERQERLAASDNYLAAWRAYMRYGMEPSQYEPGITAEQRSILAHGEQRDMGTGGLGAYPGSTAGFFAPLDFEQKVESAMKYTAPMLEVATMIDSVTGAPMGYPTDSDINTVGEQVGEGTQVSTADVPLSQATFRAYKYSSKMVKISLELAQDSAFDLEGYLVNKFAYRIGRVLNPLLTVGTGMGQPSGLISGTTVGVSGTTTPPTLGNDVLTAPDPTQQVGYLDLLNLEKTLDPVYRPGAAYMMHPNTLWYLKTIKDLNSRPMHIWRPEGGPFGSLSGYPVYPNPDMPQLAAGNTTVAFGRLDKYQVRRAGPIVVKRLSEKYAEYGQVAYIAFARRDGQLLDAGTNPVKVLVQHV